MENSSQISLVHTGIAKSKKERNEDSAKPAEAASSLKLADVKGNTESDEGLPVKASAVPVLTERNIENNVTIANSTNKMVSPVLLKLRRNQEKRVTPANPVNPVQVPPKQFLGFPAERYMSPTDSIMSPISRGLLARSRRSKRLPPAFVPPKVWRAVQLEQMNALDHTFQDAELANASSS